MDNNKARRAKAAREAYLEKAKMITADNLYQSVVGGIAGIIHDACRGYQTTPRAIAERAGVNVITVVRLRNLDTRNPQLYTVVGILRACDQLALLQLSELQRYNRVLKAAGKVVRQHQRAKKKGRPGLRVVQGGRRAA